MRKWFLLIWLIPLLGWAAAPPKPTRYVTDYALALKQSTIQELNTALEQLERTNSTQILVVIYQKLEAPVLEEFTIKTAEAWGVGQKATDNGAVLFVFLADRKMRIEVGYGLEGALPDALAKQIIDERIAPHFRNGDYDAGVRAGVAGMIQAVFGEYRGTGRTVADSQRRRGNSGFPMWIPILLFIMFFMLSTRKRGRTYRGYRSRTPWLGTWGGGGGSFGGGGWSGGGGGGFGGGFSGGGGSFGGGGASGSW